MTLIDLQAPAPRESSPTSSGCCCRWLLWAKLVKVNLQSCGKMQEKAWTWYEFKTLISCVGNIEHSLLTFFVREICGKCWKHLLTAGSGRIEIVIFHFQPFRGNPGYDEVTDLPFSTSCLTSLTENKDEINMKSITTCRMETMYNSTCINQK